MIQTHALLAAALLMAFAAPALAAKPKKSAKPAAAAAAATTTPALPELKVERHVLDNGLVVLLQEDHSVPTVTFWQWYKVGSRNEAPGITGISHFFEHMMFNGSKNVPPKEYDRIIESAGGFSSAFTDRDMTAYYEDITSDGLDILLRLDSDRMASLSLLPDLLKSEIEVVKEERRLRTDNDIEGLLDEQMWAVAFNASPYRWPVVGWMGDLNRITRDDCASYFRTYYAPNNCILVIAGDFEPAATLVKVREKFGSIPRQTPPAAPVNSEPEQKGERRVLVHHPAENESFTMGYKAPGAKNTDAPVLDVLAKILATGESSRLHRALVYEQQIALSAQGNFENRIDPGLFEIFVEMRPGKKAADGIAAVDQVLAKLAAEGPSDRELSKARNLLEADFVKGLKTNNGVGLQLGYYEHVYGDYREMFKVIDRTRAVKAEDCRRVAKQIFDAQRRTIATLVPDEENAAEVAR